MAGTSGRAVSQVVVVALAVLVACGAIYVVLNPPGAGGSGLTREAAPDGVASSAASPSASSSSPSDEPTSDPLTPLPDISTTLDLDFGRDELPGPGWRRVSVSDGQSEVQLEVRDGSLRHGGSATPAPGKGVLETRLDAPVQRIGASIRFDEFEPSGYAALTMSEDTVVGALQDETTLPRSGVRLIAVPGRWFLVVVDPGAETPEEIETVVLRGQYDAANLGRDQAYDVRRENATVWVTDPSGATSQITDDRIQDWSGPVAGWELVETEPDQVPAQIRSIYAG